MVDTLFHCAFTVGLKQVVILGLIVSYTKQTFVINTQYIFSHYSFTLDLSYFAHQK